MFENSIFKIEFSILLGLFPHHNLYRLTFQSFVLREYGQNAPSCEPLTIPSQVNPARHVMISIPDDCCTQVKIHFFGSQAIYLAHFSG